MEFTGVAGQIAGWCILITGYAVIITGLIAVWHYIIIEVLLKQVLLHFNLWEKFVTWVFDIAEFQRWRKRKN